MAKTSPAAAKKPAAKAAPGRFGALRKLLKIDGEDEGGDGDGDGDDDEDQSQGQEEQQGGEGDGDAGAGDGDEGDEGEVQDDEADAAPAGDPDANHAQYQHGVRATNRRWATVLTHPAAADRLEAATTLLAEPALSAAKIVKMLGSMPKDNNSGAGGTAAERLLARTPKHNIGSKGNAEGGDAKAGSESRKRAAERVNRNIPGAKKPAAKQED